jgi:hypothetical protein
MTVPPRPNASTGSFLSSIAAGGVTQQAAKQYAATTAEVARRKTEALRIYRPLPFQDALHRSRIKQVVLLKGNQAGGSVAGFVEDARAATGQDPYNKYPKENGIIACVGYGEQHIGRVIHKYLFRPGAFKMIRDRKTREWRVFRPWDPEETFQGMAGDLDRENESRPAPPLIPKRFIKDIAWSKRADYVFSRVELINGWQIYAANSAGDPSQFQGMQVNLVHIDEDTAMPGWLPELVNRTSIPKGLVRWTALPHMKNNELTGLIDLAAEQADDPGKNTEVLRATAYDNPYYPKESKKANEIILKSLGIDVWRQRMLGEIVLDGVLMYPTFSPNIHNAIKHDEPRTPIQAVLSSREGEPPDEWCRYAVVDPGHTVCAVTFIAVPPPDLGNFKVIYDELYLRQCTARIFAEHMAHKVMDKSFQAFIIDMHGGKLREIGSGLHPVKQYESELRNLGVQSIATRHGFIAGSADVGGRTMRLREAMSIRRDGTTEFLIVAARCPQTVAEFKRFKKKVANVAGVITPLDEGERRNIHAIDTVEMGFAHGLPYIQPKSLVMKSSGGAAIRAMRKAWQQWQQGKKAATDGKTVNLGP